MVEPLSVFVMGAGRMGEIIARSLAWNHIVTIYDRDEEKAQQVAARAGCRFSRPGASVPAAQVVILALPPDVTVSALASVQRLLQPDTVVINIATSVRKDELRKALGGAFHLAGAKIIGQYREMHEKPVIVVDADTEKSKQVAGLLFSGLGKVEQGDERLVQFINTVATREAFRAASIIEEQLRGQGIPQEMINSALRVVAAGSIKSYAAGDIGPFGRELLKEIRAASSRERART